MDSGGSSQSTSAGEDEFDESTHPDSLSSLFYPSSFGLLPSTTSYFDPVASYLDQLSRSPGPGNPNPVLNPDPGWSRDFSSSSNQETSSFQPPPPPPAREPPARNPRKRTRASRRAPTTVLTTDTTNFRSMVQEFTGIPAPPFGSAAASLFPRARLDLIGNRHNPPLFDPPATTTPFPPYLLRPFAQKLPVSLPFAPSSSSQPALTTTSTTTSAGNYQASPSDLGLLTNASSSLFFPSLLHQTRKFPLTNPDPGSSKPGSGGSLELPVTAGNDDRLPVSMGLVENFGGGHDANNPVELGEDAVVAGSGSGGGGQLRLGNADGNAAAQPWICSSSDGHGLA